MEGELFFLPRPTDQQQVWRADLRPKEVGCLLTGLLTREPGRPDPRRGPVCPALLTGQGPTLRAPGMPGRGVATGSGRGQRGSSSSTGASEQPQRVKSRLGWGRAGLQREGIQSDAQPPGDGPGGSQSSLPCKVLFTPYLLLAPFPRQHEGSAPEAAAASLMQAP